MHVVHAAGPARKRRLHRRKGRRKGTDGVHTPGAAAKVMSFGRLGKKVRPGTFGKMKVSQREYPKSPSVKQNMTFAVTPLVLTPFVPFRASLIITILLSLSLLLLLLFSEGRDIAGTRRRRAASGQLLRGLRKGGWYTRSP